MEYLPIYKFTILVGEMKVLPFQFPWSNLGCVPPPKKMGGNSNSSSNSPTSSKVTCKVAVRQELMNLLAISAERQAWQGDDGVPVSREGCVLKLVFKDMSVDFLSVQGFGVVGFNWF